MSRRVVRLVVVPAILFAVVSAATFTLAQLHLAKPEAATAPIGQGDAARGEALFAERCARCHGEEGGGGIGPALAGNPITLQDARATIEAGSGVMPAGLVEGDDLDDVLAYLDTILAGA